MKEINARDGVRGDSDESDGCGRGGMDGEVHDDCIKGTRKSTEV